jgi:murein DD-endopeptidase MepM/ murein hydrolase activator NlpD
MDKNFKFSDQPMKVKIIYVAVVAALCITAIVIGIVSVASRKNDTPPTTEKTPITEGTENGNTETEKTPETEKEPEKKPEKLTMVSPVVGEVAKYHSIDTPVFSNTLNEWRVHTGLDISADEGDGVYAAADGQVTKVYNDPFMGKTVEITHDGGIVSVYSNLSNDGIEVTEGQNVKCGAQIGTVGDTSLLELADEPHIHFEVKVGDISVNPLDYISEESKEASLGISDV